MSFRNFSNEEDEGSPIFPALDLFCFFFRAMLKKKGDFRFKPLKGKRLFLVLALFAYFLGRCQKVRDKTLCDFRLFEQKK